MTDDARRPTYGSGWIGLRFTRLRGGRPRGPRAGEEKWAFLFIAPMLIGLLFLSAAPIVATFAVSLTHWDLLTSPEPAGLTNYTRLFDDPRFLISVRNTAFYTIVSVPLGMAISLGLALALNQAIAGISWIRTMYFLPIVTSTIAVGLVWSWIYSPSNGLLNQVLDIFGIPAQRWIADPFWSMPAIIGMSIWQGLPANTIIFLAGLQAIPLVYYDAASVDGAGRWARFRHVTLPLLTPSLFFTGLLSLIGAVQVFDQVFVLNNPGKPTSATITIVYFIYEAGFRQFKMGYASAASWLLFLVVAVLTFIYFRSQRRWVHYQ
jgi:multiple sugar transport system permease protein